MVYRISTYIASALCAYRALDQAARRPVGQRPLNTSRRNYGFPLFPRAVNPRRFHSGLALVERAPLPLPSPPLCVVVVNASFHFCICCSPGWQSGAQRVNAPCTTVFLLVSPRHSRCWLFRSLSNSCCKLIDAVRSELRTLQ